MEVRYIYIFIILTIVSLVYFALANVWRIVDQPGDRSSHQTSTIRGGGILFPIAVLLWGLFMDQHHWMMIGGLVIIAGISFLDDIKGLSSKVRLVFQLIAILMLFEDLQVLQTLPWYLSLGVVILSVGIINAVNFMDGVNGITGAYGLVFLGTLVLLKPTFPAIPGSLLLYLGIGVFVFLFYNFRNGKALMFAGDVGSVSLAYMMIYFMLKIYLITNNWTVIVLLLVYGVDTIYTIMQRMAKKENIFQPHRTHFYQYLANEWKWPHLTVACLYGALQFAINYYFVIKPKHFPDSMTLLILILGISVVYFYVKSKLTKRELVVK